MCTDKAVKFITEGRRLLQQGKPDAAIKVFKHAVGSNSYSIEGWLQLGQLHMRLGEFSEAADSFQHIVDIDQDHLIANGNLGICFHRLRKLEEAIPFFRKVIQLHPGNVTALRHLATVLLDSGKRKQAAILCDRAISLQSRFAGAYMLRGAIHSASGEFELAAASYNKALELEPDVPTAIAGEANALIKLGREEQAYALILPHVETAICNVSMAIAYASTHEIHGNSSRAVEQLETLIADQSLIQRDRMQLHFSAGDLYDSMKMFDMAFSHYKSGNSYVERHFSPEVDRSRLNRTRAAFSADLLERLADTEPPVIRPVFIVGMPRSGTSLVEKILSRHSQVSAGGEMPYIPEISVSLYDSSGSKVNYPEDILDVDIANIRQRARQHQERLELIAKGRSVITDKLPHNFMYLGLIELLFPGARIIHCRRNVLDTCLSNYFQYFSGPLDYAYKLEDIACHYNHYCDYMMHWRQVLNLDMLEVDYEKLVASPEEISRELVEFCGLQWESDCLSFHESTEVTRTASYAQVRQPIYRHSVERWRCYREHLGPLINQLEEKGIDLFQETPG